MIYRKANEEDIDQIIQLRVNLLIEEAATIPANIDVELHNYFHDELNKTIVVMIAEEHNEIVSTSSVIFQKYPPAFNNKEGMRAYVANVYTLPEYRRKGINTKLMDKIVTIMSRILQQCSPLRRCFFNKTNNISDGIRHGVGIHSSNHSIAVGIYMSYCFC